jgi:hypothetical protein
MRALKAPTLHDWLDFVYHFRAFAGEAGETQDLSAPTLQLRRRHTQGHQAAD